jgi:tetratricopeptide (TPR) repeat protein/transcriptional regulator with XRE-family HTH domain
MTRPEPNLQLRGARKSKQLTRDVLAGKLGVSGYTVGRWERGEMWPDKAMIARLCQVLQQTAAELGFEDGAPPLLPTASAINDPAIPVLPAVPLIGRGQDLELLRQRLLADTYAETVLLGLPGVGKTTLATALAHDPLVEEHFGDGVLWAGLGPEPNIAGLLSRWGTLLGISSRQASVLHSAEDWTKALREAIGTREMLLVIDDAWTADEALTFRVGGPYCTHLVTTRFPIVASQISIDGVVTLRELNSEQSIDLLRHLAPQIVDFELSKAQDLVEAVGGLPLALTLMGNYLRKQAYTGQKRRIQAALQRLSDMRERLAISEVRPPAENHPSLPGDTPLSLQSIISVTDQLLVEQDSQALYALATFPPKPDSFSEEAALAVADCDTGTLDLLNDIGLLESSGPGRYALHQTIADYARLHLAEQAAELASGRLVDYATKFVETRKKDYEQLGRESSTILTALEEAYRLNKGAQLVHLALAFTPFMLARAWYEQAEKHVQRAYEAARALSSSTGTNLLPPSPSSAGTDLSCPEGSQQNGTSGHGKSVPAELAFVVEALQHQGEIALKRGNFTQADIYLQEGLKLARQIADKERISALLAKLGWVTGKRGDYAQAETYLLEGLDLAQQLQNKERICELLRIRGLLKNEQGEYGLSEAYLREGLTIARELGDLEQTCTLLINLGAAAGQQGNFGQEESYCQEGLTIARQIEHSEAMGILLANLGDAASEQGKYSAAEAYFQEGLSVVRRIGHREWTCALLINLAIMKRRQGSYQEAETYLSEALALARQVVRPQMIATALYEYGNLYLEQQQIEQARTAFNEMHAATPGGARDLTALFHFGLARTAAAQGDLQEARRLGTLSATELAAIRHRQQPVVERWLATI